MEYSYNYQYYLHFKDHVPVDAVRSAFSDYPDTMIEPVFNSSFSILSNSSFSRVKHLICTNWAEEALILILAKKLTLRCLPEETDLPDSRSAV